jgi:hypothetical protein
LHVLTLAHFVREVLGELAEGSFANHTAVKMIAW